MSLLHGLPYISHDLLWYAELNTSQGVGYRLVCWIPPPTAVQREGPAEGEKKKMYDSSE